MSAPNEIDEYKEKINTVNTQVMIAAENGLFAQRSNPISLNEILDFIRLARVQHGRAEYIDCVASISRAEGLYFTALNSTSRLWRYNNVYGGSLFIYFIGTLFFVIGFYLYIIPIYNNHPNFFIPKLGLQSIVAGIIGGLFQDIWYLWINVQNRVYRGTWRIRYISAPFIGGILGAVVYLIIIAGLLVLEKNSGTESPRSLIVIAAATFAGFNWEWAMKRFEGIGDKLTG